MFVFSFSPKHFEIIIFLQVSQIVKLQKLLSANSNTFATCLFSPPLFNDKLSLPTVRCAPTFRLTGFVYILAEEYAVVYGLARRLDSFGSCVSAQTFPGIGCRAILTTWLLLGAT